MRHADRHRNSAHRHAGHIRFALCVVAGFHRQVAVGGSQRALINGNAGLAFCGQARVPYADGQAAQPCLHGLEMDGVVFILRHIPLMGGQGYTAPFDSRIFNRNIVQFVQVVDYVRHVDSRNTARTAAADQIGVVQLGIGHLQGSLFRFQRGTVLHIGMHARTLQRSPGFDVCLCLFLHFCLFGISHAIEACGKVALVVVVHCIQDFVDGIGMAERSGLPVCIFRSAQFFHPFIDRNRQHIHGNAACADAHADHGVANLPLGFGIDRQRIVGFYGTLIHDRADRIVKCVYIHAYADTAQQSAGAGPGRVLYF